MTTSPTDIPGHIATDASTVPAAPNDVPRLVVASDSSPAVAANASDSHTEVSNLSEPAPAHMLEQRTAGVSGDKPSFVDRIEAFISRLATRDTFWHRVCSAVWLPLAFFSGIKMKRLDSQSFAAYLPFTRFNRNWYRAMAGGALLANSEIAGGMYVFGECGGDYTVVCKRLNYIFLRPCYGPAIYKMTPRENLKQLIATGSEFNLTLDLEVSQQGLGPGERDKRVGRCEAVFHVTPKSHHKAKRRRGEKKT